MKLKNQNFNKCEVDDSLKKKLKQSIDFNDSQKSLLCLLTKKIGKILLKDDVLFDTKNNFAMACVLIREIITPNVEELKLVIFIYYFYKAFS